MKLVKQKRQGLTPLLCVILFFIALWFLYPKAEATTYYVETAANGGSDAAAGTSWATSWATIDKVNSTLVGGDTVYFATGLWFGSHLQAVGGTYSDRTVYACSSFALQNGDGDYHFAQIRNSDSISDWVLHSGNIYKAAKLALTSGVPSFLMQGDSILRYYEDNISSVDAAGKYYYNSANDSLYAWVYNLGDSGYDPDAYDMQFGYDNTVDIADGEHYITFWGLHLSHARGNVIDAGEAEGDAPDSIFIEHCKLTYAIDNEANTGMIENSTQSDTDTLTNGEWWVIRSCSLLTAWEHSSGGASGMVFYSVSHMLIESCFVGGRYGQNAVSYAISFKGQTYEALNKFNTVRYTTIRPDFGIGGINFWGHTYHDSCYGNIIDGRTGITGSTPRVWRAIIGGCESYAQVGESVFVFNNTIYNTKRGYGTDYTGYGDKCQYGLVSKYNVYYNNMSASDIRNISSIDAFQYDSGAVVVDSNMYIYPVGAASKFECPDYTTYNFAGWQGIGYDVHSTNDVDPGFTDAANGDFTRAAASNEMDRTYGDRTWTIYGAIQNEGGCYNASHSLAAVETTTTSLTIHDTYNYDTDFSLTRLTMIWDDDASIASPIDSAYITTSLDSPDTLQATGLSPNTQYWLWFVSAWGTCRDTSSSITITTESNPITGRLCKGIKR